MAKQQIFDTETNKPLGTLDIPDEVLLAAAKVYDWMRSHRAIELHGLRLADDE
jgi:hypothetical protein